MGVSVMELVGGDIPVAFRGPNVTAVWLVVVNGEAYRYCASAEEAWALAGSFEPDPPPLSYRGMR